MSDLEVEAAGSGLVHIIANSEPAAALLRMFCSPDDPPTVGRGGRQFILLARGNLDDVVQRAHLAGLTIEVPQPTTTTDPAHPTDWVDPVKLQQQAAAWKQAGVPDHEIAARNFEAVLASVKQSRQMLLPHHRTYEPGTSKEEQDALMDETLAIYDRARATTGADTKNENARRRRIGSSGHYRSRVSAPLRRRRSRSSRAARSGRRWMTGSSGSSGSRCGGAGLGLNGPLMRCWVIATPVELTVILEAERTNGGPGWEFAPH